METKNKLTGKDIETLIKEYPKGSGLFYELQMPEDIQKHLQNSDYQTIEEVREDLHQERKNHVLENVSTGALITYVLAGTTIMIKSIDPNPSYLEAIISTLALFGGGGIVGSINVYCKIKRDKYRDKLGIQYSRGHLGG